MASLSAFIASLATLAAGAEAEKGFLEGILGENTGMVVGLLVVLVIVIIVAFIAKGFFDEMKK